jgi:hypothetical protein
MTTQAQFSIFDATDVRRRRRTHPTGSEADATGRLPTGFGRRDTSSDFGAALGSREWLGVEPNSSSLLT